MNPAAVGFSFLAADKARKVDLFGTRWEGDAVKSDVCSTTRGWLLRCGVWGPAGHRTRFRAIRGDGEEGSNVHSDVGRSAEDLQITVEIGTVLLGIPAALLRIPTALL